MQVVAGELGFLNIEHVLGDIGEAAFRQGFHHLQAVAVLVDDLLSKLDVLDDIALRHIF
ncbi:Uncharacterised protein [Klebsiella pneumoniae]|nr:Uncharacterised protein [Klebsiella pneumoniae]